MTKDQVVTIFEREQIAIKSRRDTFPEHSEDWLYWHGALQGAFKLCVALCKQSDESPFKDIPNPLENEFQWP